MQLTELIKENNSLKSEIAEQSKKLEKVGEYLEFKRLYESASIYTKITKIFFRNLTTKQAIEVLKCN
jgi:hypothetical protein